MGVCWEPDTTASICHLLRWLTEKQKQGCSVWCSPAPQTGDKIRGQGHTGAAGPASDVTLPLLLAGPLPLLPVLPLLLLMGSGPEGIDMMCTMPGGSHFAKQPLQLSTRQTMPAPHCLLLHGFLSPLQMKISPAHPADAICMPAIKQARTTSFWAAMLYHCRSCWCPAVVTVVAHWSGGRFSGPRRH